MSSYLKVEGSSSLVRDVGSTAIVNTDKSGYESYVKLRDMERAKQLELDRQAAELSSLKEELSSIKSLPLQLVKQNEH
jgi:hypothetical protein